MVLSMNQEALELALAAHDEGFIKTESMVYLLFGDGELCLTKAGSLFGQRSLHMIQSAKFQAAVYDFPFSFNSFRCIVLNSSDDADLIRAAM